MSEIKQRWQGWRRTWAARSDRAARAVAAMAEEHRESEARMARFVFKR